jgi:hypothetical protein
MMGNVSFRPFNANIWRAAITGWVCLAFAEAAHAGEGARNIEVVPFHSTSMNTNLEQSAQDDSQSFKVWEPTAPDSVRAVTPAPRLSNMPQPQQSRSRKEQQLQDRRRNWVFATPEDDSADKTEKSLLGLDNEDDNMTAMERYYYRLEQSGHSAATNGFSNVGRFGAQTNLYGALRNTDPGSFGETPFKVMTTPDAGVFQPSSANDISASAFGNNNSKPVLTPEEVRVQTEQKTHMDNFRQLWNIEQTPAASPVIAPASGPIDSSPLFGVSTPAGQSPGIKIPGGPTSASGASTAPPMPGPDAAPKPLGPPPSNFAPPQRLF